MFDVKDGFDIVIGNPPYVQIQELPEKDKNAYDVVGYSIPRNDRFLLDILNSSAIWFLAKSTFSSLGDAEERGCLRFFTQFVEGLPIPSTTPEQQVEVASIVDRILETMVGDPNADVTVFETEIDRHIYAFYDLTPDEIAIVEGRESGVKKAPAATTPAKSAVGAKKARKSVLTEDPDLA